MDRASDSGSEGWGFESLPAYHMSTLTLIELAWTFFLIILDIAPKGGKNATFREITRKVAFLHYSKGSFSRKLRVANRGLCATNKGLRATNKGLRVANTPLRVANRVSV